MLAHVGGMDACARGLKAAAKMLEDGKLEALRAERYAGWDEEANRAMLEEGDLASIAERVEAEAIEPKPRSGRQERLENLVNRYV